MKALILGAGCGSRLKPYTDDRPKPLVELFGHPLLEYQLTCLRSAGIQDIGLVSGYLPDKYDTYQLPTWSNPRFSETNMVYSMMCAQEFFANEEQLLVVYGDIVFEPEVLFNIIRTTGDLVVAADTDWYSYWLLRMDDPLSDAESFKMTDSGHLYEIGRKLTKREDAQGQFIGLIKFSSIALREMTCLIKELNEIPNANADAIQMTHMIDLLIKRGISVKPSLHSRGWLEIDTVEDKLRYECHYQANAIETLGFNADKLIKMKQFEGPHDRA